MVDNAIHKINYYPMDNAMGFPNTVEPSLTATSLQRPLFFSPADKKNLFIDSSFKRLYNGHSSEPVEVYLPPIVHFLCSLL